MNAMSSELVKTFLELANAIVVVVNKIGLIPTAITGAIGYFALFKQITPVGLFKEAKNSIDAYSDAVKQLNVLSQSSFNTNILNDYAQSVAGLTAKKQALALAGAGLNRQQIEEVLVKNQVDQATIQQVMSETSLASAKNLTTTATVVEALAVSTETKAKLSEDAQNWLTANSSKTLTLQLLQEAVEHGAVTAEVAEEIAAKQGLVATNQQAAGSAASLFASFKSMPMLGKVGLIITAITTVATVISWVVNKVKKSSADIEEAFDKAMQTVKDSQKTFKDLKDTAENVIPKFSELAQGVDKFGKNVSLTDDEYKEFLSLNNQIADMFPELNMGMDSNGNAMLSLSYTSDTLTQSLWDLVEAERAAANQEIADTMPDVIKGIEANVKNYKKEAEHLQQYLDARDNINDIYSDANKEEYKDSYGSDWEDEFRAHAEAAVNPYVLQLKEVFGADENIEGWEKLLDSFTFDGVVDWYGVVNSQEMQNALAGIESQIYDLQTRISKQWQQLNPVVTAWVNTDYTYNNLDSEMQSVAQAMIGNLDFEDLAAQGYDTQDKIQDYIKDYILNPINELTPSVQQELSKLMSFSPDNLSMKEYISQVKLMAQSIADGSNGMFTFDDIMQKTGYQNILNDYETTAKNILEILDDNIPQYYNDYAKGTSAYFNSFERYGEEVDDLKDKIYSLSPDEVTKSFDIIKKYGIKTWDDLVEALENKTFDVVVDLDTESEGIENLLTAIDESVSATGLSSESIANLKKRYQELADQGYDVEAMFEETTNGIHLNAQALRELESEYRKQKQSDIDDKLTGLTDHYEDLTLQINECTDASERALLYAQRDNVVDQINDTATLAAQYAGLTSAYNKWQQTQSVGNERDMYEGILEGKEEVDEELSRGWVDEGTRAYLELLSGKDLSTAKYDELLSTYKELNKAVNSSGYSVNDFFTKDSDDNSTTDGIFNFLDAVKVAQKEYGQEWVKINKDGSYSFDFGKALFNEDGIEYAGDAAIAKALGISEELVQIIIRAAQDAGFEVNLDSAYSDLADFKDNVEEVNDRLKEIKATEYTFNINSTNLNDVENQIEEAQKALQNLYNEDGTIKAKVNEEDVENAKRLLATLIYQKQTLDKAAILGIDTTNAESGVDFIVKKLQDFKAAYNQYEVEAALGVDTAESEAAMQAAITELQGTSPTIRSALGIDLLKSNEEINTAINNISADKFIEVGVDPTLVNDYVEAEHSTTGKVVWSNNIDEVTEWVNTPLQHTKAEVVWKDNFDKLTKTLTKYGTVYFKMQEYANGTAHAFGTAYAGGNWGAPKTETALVGELGPELIVDPKSGSWHTVGENGAEFTQVKKGNIIFNHKQTESLLKNGYVTSRGKLQGGAFASGTAYSKGVDGPGRTTVSSASIKGSKSSSSDAEDEFNEIFDWIEIRIEEITNDIDFRNAKLENEVGRTNQNKVVDEMIDLNQKLYNNLTAGASKYYSYAEDLLEDIPKEYREAAKDGTIAIEEFAGDADEETVDAIEEYREWVGKGDDLTQQAEETLTEISTLAKQEIDNIAQDYENINSLRENKADQLEAYNELIETTTGFESEYIYNQLIAENNAIISSLRSQRDEMQKTLNEKVASGEIKKYSQDWYDSVNAIADVDAEIIQLTTDTEEYQDTVNDLHWDKFDALINRLESISDEIDNVVDILGDKDLFNDDGEWTNEGITTLGLYAQNMEVAEKKAEEYAEEIDYLNNNWQKLGYTEEEYVERLDELKDGQNDAIKLYRDSKDAIVDLNKSRVDAIKDGIDKEIEAYQELIDVKKEELDSEKDLVDFQESVREKTKNISEIERKIDALSSDNSASARAKRAQLYSELAEAKAELEDTYYDRSITVQKDALDSSSEAFEEIKEKEKDGWDEYLEDTNKVVSDSLTTVKENTSTVYQTLKSLGEEYSLSLTESLTSPWKNGSSAISSYTEKFGDGVSSTLEELDKIEKKYEDLDKTIENEGKEAADKVEGNSNKYVEANNPTTSTSKTTNTSNATNSSKTDTSKTTTTTENKTIKVGGKIDAKGAKIYGTKGAKSGSKQYYANDPIYQVLGISGDWIKVRYHKAKSGTTGWFKKSDVKAYASGTIGIDENQFATVDELGEELIIRAHNGRLTYMEKGTGVIPSDITSNLMQLGQLDPSMVLDQNRPSINAPHVTNNETVINIEYGDILHIDNFDGNNPGELSKLIDKAFDKHMKDLNQQIRRYVR